MYIFAHGVNFCRNVILGWKLFLWIMKKLLNLKKKKIVACHTADEIIPYCVFLKEYNGMQLNNLCGEIVRGRCRISPCYSLTG